MIPQDAQMLQPTTSRPRASGDDPKGAEKIAVAKM